MPLSKNHWIVEDYKERLTISEWRRILLDDRDKIIFRGTARRLVARGIGCGVVEIGKEKPDAAARREGHD